MPHIPTGTSCDGLRMRMRPTRPITNRRNGVLVNGDSVTPLFLFYVFWSYLLYTIHNMPFRSYDWIVYSTFCEVFVGRTCRHHAGLFKKLAHVASKHVQQQLPRRLAKSNTIPSRAHNATRPKYQMGFRLQHEHAPRHVVLQPFARNVNRSIQRGTALCRFCNRKGDCMLAQAAFLSTGTVHDQTGGTHQIRVAPDIDATVHAGRDSCQQ